MALRPFEGPGGAAAADRLRQILQLVSPFHIVPSGTGGCPAIGGTIGSGFLEGSLVSAEGRKLFRRKYKNGSPEIDARQFADDIILTLTKRPGIATSQLAFTVVEPGKAPQIFVSDFEGGDLRPLTRSASHVAPALSPDGRLLASATLGQSGAGTLSVIDLATGKAQRPKIPGGQRIEACFSPDGSRLAFSLSESGGPDSDLYLVKLPRGKAERLTRTHPYPESSPSWAPDGRRLVFAAESAPGRPGLFVYDLAKKTTLPLPTGSAGAADPAWSPDGTMVAFVSLAGPNGRAICLRELVSGQTRRLTEGSQPAWGADSRHVVFSTGSGLSVIRIDTGAVRPLIGGRAIEPTWTH